MNKLSKKEAVAVAASIAVLSYIFFGNQIKSLFTNTPQTASANQSMDQLQLPQSGVTTQDVVVGTGDVAEPGDQLTVNYVGALPDGKIFDSSLDRNQPIQFVLGSGQVIRGWDQGLVGMKVGGQRILKIAPDYAYGSQAVGAVPANSPLIFEVELLKVEQPAK